MVERPPPWEPQRSRSGRGLDTRRPLKRVRRQPLPCITKLTASLGADGHSGSQSRELANTNARHCSILVLNEGRRSRDKTSAEIEHVVTFTIVLEEVSKPANVRPLPHRPRMHSRHGALQLPLGTTIPDLFYNDPAGRLDGI